MTKDSALILDMGGCIANCGHPLKIRNFSKKKPTGKIKQKKPSEIKLCDSCKAILDEDNKYRTVMVEQQQLL